MSNELTQTVDFFCKDLLVKRNRLWVRIACQEICWLEIADYFVKIFTATSPTAYLIKATLRQFEKLLPWYLFYHVHHLYIVGIRYIKHIGSGVVNLGSTEIPLERTYLKSLRHKFLMFKELPDSHASG